MYRYLLAALLIGIAFAQQAKVADVEAAYNKLKEAEAKKDPDGVLEWARKTSAAAKQVTSQPKPAGGDELDAWKRDTDYAAQVDTYTEYSMQAQVLSGIAPDKTIALTEGLIEQNPKSQYLGLIYNTYISALRTAGQTAKIVPAAEKGIAIDPANEDLMLALADGYMNQKDAGKSIQYANQLVETMKAKAKPEGMPDADWDKRKNAMLARGYWISGINYGSQDKFAECDKALRAALPLLQGQNDLLGPALFYLGVANYGLAKPAKDKKLAADAVRFSDQSAAIKSPFQAQAQKNALSIRREFLIK
jgi:hypothetical protein